MEAEDSATSGHRRHMLPVASTDLAAWGNDASENIQRNKSLPHVSSRDITGWSNDANSDEEGSIKTGKKRHEQPPRSSEDFPWGTDLDDTKKINPHLPHITKRT